MRIARRRAKALTAPTVTPAPVSIAWSASPAARAACIGAPPAWNASPAAPPAIPMLAGPSEITPASSMTGTTRSAAATGCGIPKAVPAKVAAATRETSVPPTHPSTAMRALHNGATIVRARTQPRRASTQATTSGSAITPGASRASGDTREPPPATASGASASQRTVPTTATAPATVRNPPVTTRLNSPMRIASPARAGAKVLTSEPTP